MAFWLFQAKEYQEHMPLYIVLGGEAGVPVTQSVFGPAGACKMNFGWDGDKPSKDPDTAWIEEGAHSFQAWTHTLFIETPIGLGFSYAEGETYPVKSEEEYLWIFLQRFYKIFPEYEGRRTIIQGFDLGAKTATKFTKAILDHNHAITEGQKKDVMKVDVDTLILWSPYIDPGVQASYLPKMLMHNAEGDRWLGHKKTKRYKQGFGLWKAECLGRDYEKKELLNPGLPLTGCDETQRMDRFRRLWHGLTEGYDSRNGRYPDTDPFDIRDPRQDRMSEFLYHGHKDDGLEAWLQDRNNQRKIGFVPFAEAGMEYSAFNRPIVEKMLNETCKLSL